MKYIAHRGYSLKYRENTVKAIQEAIRNNYDGVEIDVQLCKSGEIILYHDIYIDNYFVCDLTYNELSDKGVYSLQEVYEQIPELEHTFLIVDIKGNNLAICDTIELFYRNKSTEKVFFCSFNRNLVFNLPTTFLRGVTFESTFARGEYDIVTKDFNVVVLHWTCLDHTFIRYCKNVKRMCVFTYTHKEDMEMNYMLKYDVDGIITNGF
jgi:glycerophosphoryl diester phosphodiesterase|tara:strand:- start:2078 stop:2701 length:624 start_codon:yes stop_codon:yes gene_type:complete